jgi:hypothetical protein
MVRPSLASLDSAFSTRPVSGMGGFGGGIAAGGAFLAVELGARVLWTVPTLPELVQDRLVQALPGPVFAFMLSHLLYLGKPALFSTLLCLQLALAGLAGVAVAFLRRPVELALALWLVHVLRVVVGAREVQHLRAGANAGLLKDVGEPDARELPVADEVAAHFI